MLRLSFKPVVKGQLELLKMASEFITKIICERETQSQGLPAQSVAPEGKGPVLTSIFSKCAVLKGSQRIKSVVFYYSIKKEPRRPRVN